MAPPLMRNDYMTTAKIICLALLFTPSWGLWWYNADASVQDYWVFPFAFRLLSEKKTWVTFRACVQLSRIVTAASCTPARKFLASLS